jgi:hypothetical protein
MERVLYDFVVAAVLVLRRERPLPRLALLQLAARDDLNAGLLTAKTKSLVGPWPMLAQGIPYVTRGF